jgi:hypothetical protein
METRVYAGEISSGSIYDPIYAGKVKVACVYAALYTSVTMLAYVQVHEQFF